MIKLKLINKLRPSRFHNPSKPLMVQLFKAKSKKLEMIKKVPRAIKRLRKAKQKKKTQKIPKQWVNQRLEKKQIKRSTKKIQKRKRKKKSKNKAVGMCTIQHQRNRLAKKMQMKEQNNNRNLRKRSLQLNPILNKIHKSTKNQNRKHPRPILTRNKKMNPSPKK